VLMASRVGNIDPDEVLRYFSWSRFAILAVIYSAAVFWIELAKDGPFIFSNRNTRSEAQVLLAHAIFLMVSGLIAFGMANFERKWLYRESQFVGVGPTTSPPPS
jgi:hypothetical protein